MIGGKMYISLLTILLKNYLLRVVYVSNIHTVDCLLNHANNIDQLLHTLFREAASIGKYNLAIHALKHNHRIIVKENGGPACNELLVSVSLRELNDSTPRFPILGDTL